MILYRQCTLCNVIVRYAGSTVHCFCIFGLFLRVPAVKFWKLPVRKYEPWLTAFYTAILFYQFNFSNPIVFNNCTSRSWVAVHYFFMLSILIRNNRRMNAGRSDLANRCLITKICHNLTLINSPRWVTISTICGCKLSGRCTITIFSPNSGAISNGFCFLVQKNSNILLVPHRRRNLIQLFFIATVADLLVLGDSWPFCPA